MIETVSQFVQLVKDLRSAQKRWDEKHSLTDKYIKEELENKVDKALRAREQRLYQEELDKVGRLF